MTAIADAPGAPVVLRLTPDRARRWQDAALCSQVDPEIFFPEKGGSTAVALAVCRDCPVRAECLGYALAHEGIAAWGIWGGMTERQRRRLKRAAA